MPLKSTFIFFFLVLFAGSGFTQQPNLILPIGHSERVVSAKLSPNGKLALTVSTDGTAKLWETGSGKLLKDFKSQGDASIVLVTGARFSPGGKKAFIYYEYNEVRMYDIATGKFIEGEIALNDNESFYAGYYQFSPDNKRILEVTGPGRLWVLDVETLKPVFILKPPGSKISKFAYSRDGKKIVTYSSDGSVRTWDAQTGNPLMISKQTPKDVLDIAFNWDDKTIIYTIADDSPVTINVITGKKLAQLNSADKPDLLEMALYKISKDGRFCIKLNQYNGYYNEVQLLEYWDSLSVYDKKTGKLNYTKNNLVVPVASDFLSPDGNRLLALKKLDTSFCMIETATGKELFSIQRKYEIHAVNFSADGKNFIVADGDEVIIYDSQTGKPGGAFPVISGFSTVYDARISDDGKKIITGNENKKASIWDISSKTGLAPLKPVTELKAETLSLLGTQYDPSGKKIIIKTTGNDLVWDIENGSLSPLPPKNNEDTTGINWHVAARGGNITYDSLILTWLVDIIVVQNINTDESYNFWTSEKEIHNHVILSPDHKRVVATSANNSIKIYDLDNSKPILRLVIIDNYNYLVIDSSSRYDGTDAARKLLHFACGDEVVELDQVKDQLWVPDLAKRINSGETINAKTIDELSICGLTPLLERGSSATEYHFKIKPRRGGIGKTVIAVNGIEFSSYSPAELKKIGIDLEIRIPKDQLKAFFAENQENVITVRSHTADNATSSRTLSIIEDPDKEKRDPPNLFGVMVGVSNYKGESMDLEYAAIDATDISATVADAAKKLLGNDHVFMYNLTTDSGHVFPEKKTIKRTFDAIAAKASPNDILFIFLSGHGVMQDKTKQFYYMTADASSLVDESIYKDVGISMTELADWIKPQSIKAQKRILILDACKSGQAINDIITPDQRFLAVKGDDNAQQVKAIDKLNEKSGLFILSASASSQLAFESGIYEHGYLTYSLLKAIKERPDILEDGKYLNVSRWFNTAAQTVSELAKQDRARQEPQIVTNTDFNVGLVDNEVMAKINLAETKTLFTSGNFINSDIGDDDLDLRKLIDKQLSILSGTGSAKIYFLSSSNLAEAFSFTGSYSVKENSITVKVNLKKDRTIKYPFELTGTKDKLNELVDAIITKALEWIDANK